jgi:hypothetical protein
MIYSFYRFLLTDVVLVYLYPAYQQDVFIRGQKRVIVN